MNEIKNSGNKALKRSFRRTITVLIIAVAVMFAIFTAMLTFFIRSYEDSGTVSQGDLGGTLRIIRLCAMLLCPVIGGLSGFGHYRSYKQKDKLMRGTEPIECTLKDILITSYYYKGKLRYYFAPVLENAGNGELYCTLRYYNMSFYSTVYNYTGSSVSFNIKRGDGSNVELGDTVHVYIKETLDLGVSVNGDEYTADGKRHKFDHKNKSLGIEIISRMTFFSGIVDVD